MIFGFGYFGFFTFANVVSQEASELCWKDISDPGGDWIILPKKPDFCA